MKNVAKILFSLAFAGLLTHELDAMHKHEWRLLFVLRSMPDPAARQGFVLMHIPLVAGLLWLLTHANETVRARTMTVLDLFMIVHAGLHWRLTHHPNYEFHPWHSRFLIHGTAAAALAHLTIEQIGTASSSSRKEQTR
jgi:hypothetical protein